MRLCQNRVRVRKHISKYRFNKPLLQIPPQNTIPVVGEYAAIAVWYNVTLWLTFDLNDQAIMKPRINSWGWKIMLLVSVLAVLIAMLSLLFIV